MMERMNYTVQWGRFFTREKSVVCDRMHRLDNGAVLFTAYIDNEDKEIAYFANPKAVWFVGVAR